MIQTEGPTHTPTWLFAISTARSDSIARVFGMKVRFWAVIVWSCCPCGQS
jgi:hypothetical protein